MASRTIITQVFRASHVHLAEKKSFNTGDIPAYMISAMFPKSNQGSIAATGVSFPSHYQDILQALQEVTAEEFGGWRFNPAECQVYGIQYPPQFKDGDQRPQKDANKNPIVVNGQIVTDPITRGFTLLTLKSTDAVGVVGPDAQPIDPKAVYSGCWCRAQIEVSAYINQSKARIISIRLLNVMMCYADENFGGRQPVQNAATAFAGQAVANTNIPVGTGQQFTPTPPATAGAALPPPAPMAPPAPAPVVPVYVHLDATCTKEQYLAAGWTQELLVANGKGRMDTPAPVVVTPPPVPAAPTALALPVAPPVAPPVPAPMAPPPAPVAPIAPPAPALPLTGKVVMKADSPYPYATLISSGWNDDQIIAAGYATPNYTNP